MALNVDKLPDRAALVRAIWAQVRRDLRRGVVTGSREHQQAMRESEAEFAAWNAEFTAACKRSAAPRRKVREGDPRRAPSGLPAQSKQGAAPSHAARPRRRAK